MRAVTHPYPGAFCFADRKKLLVWNATIAFEGGNRGATGQIVREGSDGSIEVAAGEGSVTLSLVQFENGVEQTAREALAALNSDFNHMLE